MSPSSKFLRIGARVFVVLAWVSLVVQVGVGVFILAVGGDPVMFAGVDVPARLLGLLNCIGGAVYFFLLLLISHVLRVLLEIRQRLEKP